MTVPKRSKALQIYLKPGVRDDDLILQVWESCADKDRPQDVFRTMLRRGLFVMLENEELPESVIDECQLDLLLDKKRRRAAVGRRADPQQPDYRPQAYYPVQPRPEPHYAQPEPRFEPPRQPYPDQGRGAPEPMLPISDPFRQEAPSRTPDSAPAPAAYAETPSAASNPPADTRPSQGRRKLGNLM